MAEASGDTITALTGMMDARLAEVNTCIKGVIASYADGFANVTPKGSRRFSDGDVVVMPMIYKVPIVWPAFAGGRAGVKGPVAAGDECLLVFSQQAADDTDDMRQFDLTDAYAILCAPGSAGPGNDALTVFYGDASISISAAGGVEIIAPGGLTINGAVTQTGGDMTSNGIVAATHIHTKVQAGAAKSGPPYG